MVQNQLRYHSGSIKSKIKFETKIPRTKKKNSFSAFKECYVCTTSTSHDQGNQTHHPTNESKHIQFGMNVPNDLTAISKCRELEKKCAWDLSWLFVKMCKIYIQWTREKNHTFFSLVVHSVIQLGLFISSSVFFCCCSCSFCCLQLHFISIRFFFSVYG